MGLVNLLLWAGGIVLIAVGYRAARDPWRRYQARKAQDENIARYESWRGGVRDDGKTGSSGTMELLRRQARVGGAIAIVGVVMVFVGFLIR